MELNPNHPVTQSVSGHWHKIAAILLHKLGKSEVRITLEDLQAWDRDYPSGAIVIKSNNHDFLLKLVSEAEAQRISREEGGLPI